jgi:hypothetical protein
VSTVEPAAPIEYFIGYSASSNASFGSRDAFGQRPDDDEWTPWDGDESFTADQVVEALCEPQNGERANLPRGLAEAIEASGFEWWVEAREIGAS